MKIVKNALEVLSPWEVKGLDALLTFLKGISTTKAEDRRNLKRSVPKGLKNIDNLLRKFTQHMNRARSKRVEGKDLIPMSRVDTPSHASSETSSVVVSGGGEVDQKPPASTEQQDMDVPTPSGVPTTLLELAQPISDSEDSDDGEKNGGGGPLDDADDSSDWDDGSDDDEDSEDMYGGNTTDSADEDAHAYIPGKFKKKRPMTTRKRKLEADVEKTSMAAEDKSVGGTPPATVAAPAKRRKKSSTAAAAAAATPDPPMAGNALKTSLQGRGASSASPLPHPVDPQQKTEEAVASGKEKDRVASATLPATATVRGGSVASGARQESKEIGVKIAFTPQLPSDAPAWVTGHAPHQPLNVPARHVPGGSAAQPLGLGQAPGEPQTAPVVTSTTPRAPTAASTKLPQFKSVAATSAQQRQSPNTLQFQPLAAAPQQRPAFKPSNMNGSSPSGNLMSGLPPFLMPLPGAAPTSYIPPAPASASAPNPLFVPDPIPPPPPRSASASTSAALPFPYWAFAPNVGGGEASAPNNAASLPPFLGCMAPAPSSSTMIPFPIMGAFAPDAMASGGPYLVQQQAQLPPHQELAFPVYHPHEQPLLLANHLEQFQQHRWCHNSNRRMVITYNCSRRRRRLHSSNRSNTNNSPHPHLQSP
ncbi:uncharacterized protein EV422DRAFT_113143 [Fimicolochytrium jonesii]|uniref:uncharacterized protein n=1 Tax=Fimicolochytrium jonesii TaxID=1396493 RepID=UPI0022FDC453|nr:uncharacterized protein EV422DRAFT_113143 [Fimicolochytrium jonesii]KAI8819447.1 hypothetical protein EV422DRAFT_113143 [Fimicolochytrium jonesii]